MKSFFNSEAFYQLRDGLRYLHFGDEALSIRFYEADNQWMSLPRATFGGFEHEGLMPDRLQLDGLLREVVEQARLAKSSGLRILLPPRFYCEESYDFQVTALESAGFKVLYLDTNYQIPIANQSFSSRITPAERHKLNRAKRAKLSFQWVSKSEWPIEDVHRILMQSRERKGYPMGITQSDLHLMSNVDAYNLALVKSEDGEIVALALCIKTTDDVLYTFMTGDVVSFRFCSPVVLLHNELYTYCQSNGYSWLDLGTCGSKGIPNPGVASFKKHLGALSCPKSTWIWEF